MALVGDIPFFVPNVAGNTETTAFDYIFQGRIKAYFTVLGLFVNCITGLGDYAVFMYKNNILLPFSFRSEGKQLAEIDLKTLNLQLNDGDDFRASLYHFETLNHDFFLTLKGIGNI